MSAQSTIANASGNVRAPLLADREWIGVSARGEQAIDETVRGDFAALAAREVAVLFASRVLERLSRWNAGAAGCLLTQRGKGLRWQVRMIYYVVKDEGWRSEGNVGVANTNLGGTEQVLAAGQDPLRTTRACPTPSVGISRKGESPVLR